MNRGASVRWRGIVRKAANRLAPVLIILAPMAAARPAWACKSGIIRDAAFEAERDEHLLCVIGNATDSAANTIFDTLDTWRRGEGKELNVTIRRLNADDPSVPWQEYGIPSAPPALPVVALIGMFPSPKRPFVIDHWEPGPTEEQLAALRTSPAREALKKRIVDSWAVVLHAPGTGSAPGKTEGVLKAVSEKWAEEQPPGISIVTLDRTDPRESLLCAFTGIERRGPDWAGVVFGRGKLMAPPLAGSDITEKNLNQLLENLTAECSCLQDATSLGLDIPMTWEAALDDLVAPLGAPSEYEEITIEERMEAVAEAEVPDEGRSMLATAALTTGLAAVTVLGATVVMLIRRKDRTLG